MKLTKRQRQELEALAEAPRSTHNRRFDNGRRIGGCARVQNSLRQLGLARFCEADGSEPPLSLLMIAASYGNPRPQCRITDKGRAVLAELKAKGKRAA